LAALLSKMNREIETSGSGIVTIGGIEWTIRRQLLDDLRSHDLPAAISKIACPTLLFHSPVDQTLLFDHAIRIMGLIQNSPTETPVSLISIADADHLLTSQDSDIEFFVSTTAAFLNRYARP